QLGNHVGAGLAALLLEGHPPVHEPRQALLAVADDENVNERGEQFRVLSTGAAAYYKGVADAAILGVQRDAAQVEHIEDVGVTNLVLQAEADHIELAQRRERLQRVEGQATAA